MSRLIFDCLSYLSKVFFVRLFIVRFSSWRVIHITSSNRLMRFNQKTSCQSRGEEEGEKEEERPDLLDSIPYSFPFN